MKYEDFVKSVEGPAAEESVAQKKLRLGERKSALEMSIGSLTPAAEDSGKYEIEDETGNRTPFESVDPALKAANAERNAASRAIDEAELERVKKELAELG